MSEIKNKKNSKYKKYQNKKKKCKKLFKAPSTTPRQKNKLMPIELFSSVTQVLRVY